MDLSIFYLFSSERGHGEGGGMFWRIYYLELIPERERKRGKRRQYWQKGVGGRGRGVGGLWKNVGSKSADLSPGASSGLESTL